jgi:hypothetical protein
MDFGSTPLAWEQKDDSTEQFTIEIASAGDGGELQFLWGTNVLTTKFQAK